MALSSACISCSACSFLSWPYRSFRSLASCASFFRSGSHTILPRKLSLRLPAPAAGVYPLETQHQIGSDALKVGQHPARAVHTQQPADLTTREDTKEGGREEVDARHEASELRDRPALEELLALFDAHFARGAPMRRKLASTWWSQAEDAKAQVKAKIERSMPTPKQTRRRLSELPILEDDEPLDELGASEGAVVGAQPAIVMV